MKKVRCIAGLLASKRKKRTDEQCNLETPFDNNKSMSKNSIQNYVWDIATAC